MDSPIKKRILITGLSGFTGRHLAKLLADHGWEVFGLGAAADDLPYPNLVADLNETGAMVRWLGEIRPTHIVHLAAQSHVVGDPLRFFQVNVLGTESLLEAVGGAGLNPEKILIASSANIYGNAGAIRIAESQPAHPMNHYALSKAAMELLVKKWFDRYPIVIVRPFNYTGPGQSAGFLFAKIVAAFHRRDPKLKLGNLDVSRDLSDISFVVEAYKRLLLLPLSSEIFNICSGSGISIAQTIRIMQEMTGYSPEIIVDQALIRKDEIRELTGDPAKLLSAIGSLEPVPQPVIFANMIAALASGQ